MCQASVDPTKSLIHNIQTCFHDCGSLIENVNLTRMMNVDPEMNHDLLTIHEQIAEARRGLLSLFAIEYGRIPQ